MVRERELVFEYQLRSTSSFVLVVNIPLVASPPDLIRWRSRRDCHSREDDGQGENIPQHHGFKGQPSVVCVFWEHFQETPV